MRNLKKMLVGSALLVCLTLLAVPAMATTHKNTKTIEAGDKGIYYVLDSKIAEHGISANQFTVEPESVNTVYDIVYATGSNASPSIMSLVGYKQKLTSKATNAYIKSSAGADTGAVLGIRVSKGSVKLTVYSTSNNDTMGLSLMNRPSTATPLRGKTLAKNRSINFQMSKGNVANIPLIFGGTKGSKIKRTISSTKYEVYSFGASQMTRTVYTNGVKGAVTRITYQTKYKSSGKTYLCTMIPVPASATNRASGWMKNTKGSIAFFYVRDYLGMKYAQK